MVICAERGRFDCKSWTGLLVLNVDVDGVCRRGERSRTYIPTQRSSCLVQNGNHETCNMMASTDLESSWSQLLPTMSGLVTRIAAFGNFEVANIAASIEPSFKNPP